MRKHVCFLVAMLAFSGATFAQSSTPPIKMGLWRSTSTSRISGIQLPPEVAARLKAMGRQLPMGEPHTVVVQSCVTPDSWKDMFKDVQRDHDCTFTTMRQTSTGLSMDVACKSAESSSKVHMDVTFVNSEKMEGKAHGEAVSQRQSQPIVFDTSFDSIYQGADCKGISPSKAEVIH